MSHTVDDLSTWSWTSVWSRKVLVALGSGSLQKEVYRWEWALRLYISSPSFPICFVCGQICDLPVPTTMLSLTVAMPFFPRQTSFSGAINKNESFLPSLRCFARMICHSSINLTNTISLSRPSCSLTHGCPPAATTQCAEIT